MKQTCRCAIAVLLAGIILGTASVADEGKAGASATDSQADSNKEKRSSGDDAEQDKEPQVNSSQHSTAYDNAHSSGSSLPQLALERGTAVRGAGPHLCWPSAIAARRVTGS